MGIVLDNPVKHQPVTLWHWPSLTVTTWGLLWGCPSEQRKGSKFTLYLLAVVLWLSQQSACADSDRKSKVLFTPRTDASLRYAQICEGLLNSDCNMQSSVSAWFIPATVVAWPQFKTEPPNCVMRLYILFCSLVGFSLPWFKHRHKHWAWEVTETLDVGEVLN